MSAENHCPQCEQHKQAAFDAMSLGNDLCERREKIIAKLVEICAAEAEELAKYRSRDGSIAALREAAEVGTQFLKSITLGDSQPPAVPNGGALETPAAIKTVCEIFSAHVPRA